MPDNLKTIRVHLDFSGDRCSMSSQSTATIYSFLDFKFIPSQHQLHHQNQTVQLSKKNHDLLVALVQSNGQVLEKDQLIEISLDAGQTLRCAVPLSPEACTSESQIQQPATE